MEVELEVSEKFKPLYSLPIGTHTVILIGGRSSGYENIRGQ